MEQEQKTKPQMFLYKSNNFKLKQNVSPGYKRNL